MHFIGAIMSIVGAFARVLLILMIGSCGVPGQSTADSHWMGVALFVSICERLIQPAGSMPFFI